MPPIEVGSTRAIGPVTAGATAATGAKPGIRNGAGVPAPAPAPKPASAVQTNPVQTSAALHAGAAPVDTDRVAVIRKAVESGTYPIIPTRIADAMIAAGVMLQSGKA
jgi:negative regulator of flagellin synthesis FlgM